MEGAYAAAVEEGTAVRALAMINPGNPVGAVLSEEAVAELVCFAAAKSLVLLADEVYQINVYAEGKAFHSAKKVLRKLQDGSLAVPASCGGKCGAAELQAAQMISFHSTSKGLIGECGQRGGYLEMVGFSEATLGQFTKVAATSLSSCTIGQVFIGLMVQGPAKGSPSQQLFDQEAQEIMAGLKRRALQATAALNEMPGIRCQPIEGAMYAFPSLALPARFVAKCAEIGQAADEAWCLELMESTGIVCVPGSGFGQKTGTFHVRMTILPPDDLFASMLKKLASFQVELHKEWEG
uniref:Aminotransferase class I/classII large domain-containing protein n=2 Tax=Calcidiscus leptoporus TaxID=127549 RepID=A0A7S0J083_9EUKA|mmetsp:Transcript_31892/g.74330  ORF Transcript_31892/g.74330 Transcript_31892/m.74330 type:complete len:294 (+) Transcript_31892:2-883(+)